jgi:Na+/H+ antiporter
MEVFEVVIALLLVGAALAALARRMATPYPALMALAGLALALVPGTPTVVLDPELALALFVAPVLLDAAFDSSQRDLRANWRWVTSLALGAVALTVLSVALLVRALVPEMPWAAAIALGAIVAPPDAAAATAVLKQLRPPNRLLVILEGESLFNDASALLIYRLAVGALLAGAISAADVIPTLLIVTAGSVVLGLALSRVTLLITPRIKDVATSVIVQFCGTFMVWIIAEQLHLSGIITMVVYAMAVARRAADAIPARIRIPSYAVWEVAVFVLNVLAFIVVGLQLKSIGARLDRTEWIDYTRVALAVCAAIILVRMVAVVGVAAFNRWWCRRQSAAGAASEIPAMSARASVLIGWCGMRGIVTLAAALALPTALRTGEPFPFRDLILFTAFGVVVATLVLQGMSLRWLLNLLRLEDDGTVEREVQLARRETLKAGLASVANLNDDAARLLRHRYELMLQRLESHPVTNGADQDVSGDNKALRIAASAERQCLIGLRANGTIGDAAFQRVEQELDWSELGIISDDQFAT